MMEDTTVPHAILLLPWMRTGIHLECAFLTDVQSTPMPYLTAGVDFDTTKVLMMDSKKDDDENACRLVHPCLYAYRDTVALDAFIKKGTL